jgi:uncharacterized protein YggE
MCNIRLNSLKIIFTSDSGKKINSTFKRQTSEMKKTITILLFSLCVMTFGQTQKTEKSKLNATGAAKISVKPDLCIIHLGASELRSTMSDAIRTLGEKSDDYNRLLQQLGFSEKEIKTTNFTVSKNRVYRDNGYIDSGYIASQSIRLEFTYKQQMLQKIITEFSKQEKPVDFSFDFDLSETLKQKTQLEIIEAAIKDAHDKAAVMAKASSLKLLNISSISYGSCTPDNNIVLMDRTQKYTTAMVGDSGMPSFNFTPADLVFQDAVTIQWYIK